MALELIIVTPEGQSYEGSVDHVVLPGAEGDFGVLAEHERYLAPLKPGPVEIRTGKGSEWAAVSEGFADVNGQQVVVLVDHCALASEIDREAAETERRDAEAVLADAPTETERAEAESALVRATVHLDVVGR